MKLFELPPWLKRTKDSASASATTRPARALVKYEPPPAADPTDGESLNGWTPETLAADQAESDARAMAIVAARMEGRFRPRPRWANNRYDPLHWRGRTTKGA